MNLAKYPGAGGFRRSGAPSAPRCRRRDTCLIWGVQVGMVIALVVGLEVTLHSGVMIALLLLYEVGINILSEPIWVDTCQRLRC